MGAPPPLLAYTTTIHTTPTPTTTTPSLICPLISQPLNSEGSIDTTLTIDTRGKFCDYLLRWLECCYYRHKHINSSDVDQDSTRVSQHLGRYLLFHVVRSEASSLASSQLF